MATQQESPPQGDMVLVYLNDGNLGDHMIVGNATKTRYGYKSSGDKFYIATADFNAAPHSFRREEERKVEAEPAAPPQPPPPPFDMTTIWGINEKRAEKLREMGVRSPRGLLMLSEEDLSKIMPESSVKRVLEDARSHVDDPADGAGDVEN